MKQNRFGKYLEQFLLATGIKSYQLAQALNYDVSYISKWITGKSYPSKKNIEKTLTIISEMIVSQCPYDTKVKFFQHFNTSDDEALQVAISDILRESYYNTLGTTQEYLYLHNATMKISSREPIAPLTSYVNILKTYTDQNIIVMADLFSLDSSSQLQLAGIQNYNFIFQNIISSGKINFIINIENLHGHNVHDVLLLIHMMTNYSLSTFELYHHTCVEKILLLAIENDFSGTAILGQNRQCICSTSSSDPQLASNMHQTLQQYLDADKKIFFNTNMENFLLKREYLQTLLSQEPRWLVGHITEHFISPTLFQQLLQEYFPLKMHKELERAYLLNLDMLKKGKIKILFYSLSIVDFALSGELDFFNQKVLLSQEQRRNELIYLQELFSKLTPLNLKLITEGFSEDFKYISNPCIFLSDSLSYLRLENKHYTNNIMVTRDRNMQQIFDSFYNSIWEYSGNTLVTDAHEIEMKLNSLIDASSIFTD